MNKRYVFILIILLTINSLGFVAQDNGSLENTTDQAAGQIQNGIYLELGGNAGVYSINYERLFSLGKISIAGRMGFSLLSERLFIEPEENKGLEILIPFGANALYSFAGSHSIEAGLSGTYYSHKVYAITTNTSNINNQPVSTDLIRKNDFWLNFNMGYRFQKSTSGMYYRAFFNGHLSRRVLADSPNSHSQYSVLTLDPWAGISVGYGF
ncbi:MAG: hypothetical protein HOK65_09715 [Crocinitomicaceae bacterium]|nr:hypothetical protein [Crocinitomicaceae bacterium]